LVLLRLGEARDRLVLAVVDVEDEGELRDHEDVLDPLVDTAQLHLALPLGVVRVPGDEHAQSGRVDVLGLTEVDHQVQIALGREIANELFELVRLLASHQVSTRRGDHDPVQPPDLHVLHPVLRRLGSTASRSAAAGPSSHQVDSDPAPAPCDRPRWLFPSAPSSGSPGPTTPTTVAVWDPSGRPNPETRWHGPSSFRGGNRTPNAAVRSLPRWSYCPAPRRPAIPERPPRSDRASPD